MATNEELKEAVKLAKELDRLRVKLGKEPLKLTDQQALKQLKDLPRDIREAEIALSDMEGTASNLYANLRAISSEFKGQPTIIKKTRGAFRELEKSAQNLKLDEQGILDLNKRQAEALADKAKKNQAILKQEASSLIANNKIASYLDKQVQKMVDEGASADLINDYVSSRLKNVKSLSDEEKALLQTYLDQNDPLGKIVQASEKRVKLESKINDLMGVTGALVGGTGALMERLGMRSGIFHEAMSDAQKRMREMAKDTAEGVEKFSKLAIAAEGFSIVLKGFGKALRDPAAIIGAITNGFFEVNKAAVEFTRFTGQASTRLNGVKTEVATLSNLLKTSAELTKEMGLNAAAIFSPKQTAELADMQLLLGLSVEQTGQLGTLMNLTGKSAKELRSEIYANVDAGVSQEVVSQDILSASKDILAATGGNTKELGKAANAARKLGMTLSQVDKIADGLLDFESSISSELEAQLLTGKNINLAKARELALNNDLAGLAEELASNGASAAEFANMNRVQQKALAQALGMSRQELGAMVLSQANLNTLTDEEKAKIRGVSEEQSRQMDIQQRIQQSVNKLAQAFAPVLEAVVPIVEALLSIVGPIAKGVGLVANAFSGFIGPLATAAGILYSINTVMGLITAAQMRLTAAKAMELGLGGQILSVIGLQNAAEMYKLTLMEGGNTLAAIKAGLEETILGSMILQGYEIIKNIGKATIELGIRMGIASAALLTNSAATFGIGAAVAVAAALAGYALFKAATADDMVSSPGYGDRTLLGPEGAIQLNNKDTVIAGTNLFGGEGGTPVNTPGQSIDGSVINVDTRALEAKLDKLIAAVNAGGNVYLDGNKVGSAQVLGTYKSS